MPTWGEILAELHQSAQARGGAPDFDGIRRKYLAQLHAYTGRDVIIYYTDWLSGNQIHTSITLEDVQAMMEVCKDLRSGTLDLILHTPGGSPEAADSVVRYLRKRFRHVRAFVPVAAMSAGTMWALAANEIVMGKHSQLGPIDPQIAVPVAVGQHVVYRYVPARAIIEQFEKAKAECQDPALLAAWFPILQQYGPGLLSQCEDAEVLAKRLTKEWLTKWMLAGLPEPERESKATQIADFFGDYTLHRSHSLGIDRDAARERGVLVLDLEADPDLQDAVLSVHHATMHTFQGPAVKIVENHMGRAYVKLAVQVPLAVPSAAQPAGPGA
jgi:hypothetical protein